MKVDVNQLGLILLIIWTIQISIYSIQLLFPGLINLGIRKTLIISILTCIILATTILIGDFYESTPRAPCGDEKFNPIGILGIYGSIGSLCIHLIISTINKIVNRRRGTRS